MALAGLPEDIKRHGESSWRLGSEVFFNQFYGFVTAKHQTWTQDFLLISERLKAAGIVDHLIRKQIKNKAFLDGGAKQKGIKTSLKPFHLGHYVGGYIILATGYLCGFVVFCWEYFVSSKLEPSRTISNEHA